MVASSILRPSDRKTLERLKTDELTFTELQKKAKLSPRALSSSLRNLQSYGLIERNFKTRKYRALPRELKVLFYSDLRDFIDHILRKIVEGKDENPEISPSAGWLLITDKEDFDIREAYQKKMRNPRYRRSDYFSDPEDFVLKLWKTYVLSSFRDGEQVIIRKYERTLFEYRRQFKIINSREVFRKLYSSILSNSEATLVERYPNVIPPKKMIYLYAARRFRSYIKHLIKLDMAFVKITEEGLSMPKELLSISQSSGATDVNVFKQPREFKTFFEFLFAKSNLKLYKRYREKYEGMPKAVLVYPIGFSGYKEMLEKWFPDQAKKFEEQREKYFSEGLQYSNIK